jgi:hypothetical protein
MKNDSEQEMPDFLKDFIRRHKPADLTIEEWAAAGREDIRKEEANKRMQRAAASIEWRLKERRALRPIGNIAPVSAVSQNSKDGSKEDEQMDFDALEDFR